MFLEQNLNFEIEFKQVSKRSSYLRLQALLGQISDLPPPPTSCVTRSRRFRDRRNASILPRSNSWQVSLRSCSFEIKARHRYRFPSSCNKRLLLFLVSQPTCAESCLGFDSVARSLACITPRRPRVTLPDRRWKSPEKRHQTDRRAMARRHWRSALHWQDSSHFSEKYFRLHKNSQFSKLAFG